MPTCFLPMPDGAQSICLKLIVSVAVTDLMMHRETPQMLF
jgi:hypothetical protein